MGNEQYLIDISDASMTFEFVSEGPKGAILKRVQYKLTHRKNVYNLALGDVNPETNAFDDGVISNNGDTKKVLATVASTVYLFVKKYPKAIIYAEGNSPARTRLYRIGISNNLEELKKEFDVFGFLDNAGWEEYQKNKDYSAFFIKQKIY